MTHLNMLKKYRVAAIIVTWFLLLRRPMKAITSHYGIEPTGSGVSLELDVDMLLTQSHDFIHVALEILFVNARISRGELVVESF